MARNFLVFPFAPYIGQFSSKPFATKEGRIALMVTARVPWPVYNVGGQSLGNNNPDFSVQVNLNAAAANTVSQLWTIKSVYIDNEANNFPVYVYFIDTQFAISCPPNSAGWYQVFTGARSMLLSCVGITDNDVNAGAVTNFFFTDAEMVPYLDQENQSAIDMRLASPSISLGGGGLISGIAVTANGSGYTSAGISITGGGGINGAAHAVLDTYGRIASVVIDNPGQNYTGPPLVVPTGANPAPPAWATNHGYNQGELVSYPNVNDNNNLFTWQAAQASNSVTPGTANQFGQFPWNSIVRCSLTAALSPSVTSGTASLKSATYGPAALGDQAQNYIDSIPAVGTFRDSLWGTPFNSGFIYLTSVHVGVMNAAANIEWLLENSDQGELFNFHNSAATAGSTLLSLSNCNIKLDASLEWRIRCSSYAGAAGQIVSHGFTWTYNPNT